MTAERSFLFVPADRPERYAKALAAGADCVIIDLEDAVSPDAKEVARETVARWLGSAEARDVLVRVNPPTTTCYEEDMRALAHLQHVAGLMLPKAEEVDAIAATRARTRPEASLIGLVETVRGFAGLRAVAQAPGMTRLAFGSVDFCLETGIQGQGAELDFVRAQLILESCLAGLAAPVEGVTVDIRSVDLLQADIERARRYGFGGKLCIHPSQVGPINSGFSPSPETIDWARRVLAAASSGVGALTVDGKLVDRPVILRAEKILTQSAAAAS